MAVHPLRSVRKLGLIWILGFFIHLVFVIAVNSTRLFGDPEDSEGNKEDSGLVWAIVVSPIVGTWLILGFVLVLSAGKSVTVTQQSVRLDRHLECGDCCCTLPLHQVTHIEYPASCVLVRCIKCGVPLSCSDNLVYSKGPEMCDLAVFTTPEDPEALIADISNTRMAQGLSPVGPPARVPPMGGVVHGPGYTAYPMNQPHTGAHAPYSHQPEPGVPLQYQYSGYPHQAAPYGSHKGGNGAAPAKGNHHPSASSSHSESSSSALNSSTSESSST